MPRIVPGLAFRYSGGSNNTSLYASIGGQVSTHVNGAIASQNYTQSTIPGIRIDHAARNALGNGTLSFSVANNSLTWTDSASHVDTIALTGGGMATLGSASNGFLRVYVDLVTLGAADASQLINITEKDGTLFSSPSASEMSAGSTEYRCVYLVNESAGDMNQVSLVIADFAGHSSVHIGSLFDPVSRYSTSSADMQSMAFSSFLTGTPPSALCTHPTYQRERLHMLNRVGYPDFTAYPTDFVQESNGVDVDVPPALADRFDSTNLLASVQWDTQLAWPYIKAGKMVSFYVRRILPPNPVIPTFEYFDIDMLLVAS